MDNIRRYRPWVLQSRLRKINDSEFISNIYNNNNNRISIWLQICRLQE